MGAFIECWHSKPASKSTNRFILEAWKTDTQV
jgi:hypothetical protein